jgi:hypothetical protein
MAGDEPRFPSSLREGGGCPPWCLPRGWKHLHHRGSRSVVKAVSGGSCVDGFGAPLFGVTSSGISGLATCGTWRRCPFEEVVSKLSLSDCPSLLPWGAGGSASGSCSRRPPSMSVGCVVSSASPSVASRWWECCRWCERSWWASTTLVWSCWHAPWSSASGCLVVCDHRRWWSLGKRRQAVVGRGWS